MNRSTQTDYARRPALPRRTALNYLQFMGASLLNAVQERRLEPLDQPTRRVRCEVAAEDITSGGMLFIHLMLRVATGDDSDELWEEFQRQAGYTDSESTGPR